jgi:hypothetical protein
VLFALVLRTKKQRAGNHCRLGINSRTLYERVFMSLAIKTPAL